MSTVRKSLCVALSIALLAAPALAEKPKKAKYVFLFIGDGMSIAQVSAAEIYAKSMAGAEPGFQKLGFTQFPAQGLTTTYDSSSIITDSASAVTAIATGNKTLSGVINMDPGKTKRYKTIAEYAKEMGWRVGVVTTVSLDHATPAGFYAKVPSRGDMYDIACQLSASGFDFFGGGGFCQPTGKKGDQEDAIALAAKRGYTVVKTAAELKALKPAAGLKVIAFNETLQDSMAMPYEIDRAKEDLALADYVDKGIELLDNKNGFFFAVESGKIDWACHANDAAASIGDTLAFDRAIARAVEFQKKHPNDTLIIVTGDHETGGMSIGFAGTKYSTFFEKVAMQKGSYIAFDERILAPYKKLKGAGGGNVADLIAPMKEWFGVDYAALDEPSRELVDRAFKRSMKGEVERATQESVYNLYGGYEPLTVTLTHLANQAAGIGWTTYSHTGVPVPTYALGAGQSLFDGYYDNTDLFRKLVAVMGIRVAEEKAK
ncbi:MAG TPA: alkaline phosphatase [Treponemataceae bacterium]|jgi:alkaline phosphatase|nr:alkaline phosphatase [Treponemataceae bacterium]